MPASQQLWIEKVLTDAEIKALPNVFPEIVAAPGAGKMIKFDSGVVIVDCQAGPYDNIDDGCDIAFFVSDQVSALLANSASFTLVTNLLTDDSGVNYTVLSPQARLYGTVSGTDLSGTLQAGRVRSASDATNQPLLFGADNGILGNFTMGNAANSMKITAFYYIIDV